MRFVRGTVLDLNREMKKKTIVLIAILVVSGAAAIAYFMFNKKSTTVTLVTAKAQKGYIAESVTATGEIQPVDSVSVGAQVSGVVKTVYVDFNSIVTKGQLLAKVDPTIAAAQTEQFKANRNNARSNLEFQKTNFNRQSQLFQLEAISKADYQIALNQYNIAKSDVASASAQLSVAEKNLSYTNIYSPIDGVVLNRNVSAGQTIASSFNAPTLFVIAKDLTKMQVRAKVNEADIGGVKLGQNVTFTVDAFPEDIFKGTVHTILLNPSKSANIVSYVTLVNVDNPDLKLKPGMTASLNIYVQEDSNALLIPSRALSFKPDSSVLKDYTIVRTGRDIKGDVVWVQSGDTLTERIIVTGLNDNTSVMVISGLSPDETVILSVLTEDKKAAAADNAQRSPFMPQVPKRPSGGSRN